MTVGEKTHVEERKGSVGGGTDVGFIEPDCHHIGDDVLMSVWNGLGMS